MIQFLSDHFWQIWFSIGVFNALILSYYLFCIEKNSEVWNNDETALLGILLYIACLIIIILLGVFNCAMILDPNGFEMYRETIFNRKFIKNLLYFSPILSLGLLWLI